jgi:hypothetical protein
MKKIYFNSKNTGVQTLRSTAYFILVAGLIATLIAFINCFVSTGRYSDDVEFLWSGFVIVLLIFAATLLGFGVCLLLAYLGESAFVARKQREELLAVNGIKLFFEGIETIKIKNKKSGWISNVTLSNFEELKARVGEDAYEILE